MSMSEREKKGISTDSLLNEAYNHFQNGQFDEGGNILEKALSHHYDNDDVLTALKCASFWGREKSRYDSLEDSFQRGEFLLKEWRNFIIYTRKFLESNESGQYAIRKWVFGNALRDYQKTIEDQGGLDTELLLRLGRCYKGRGNYEHALDFYEKLLNEKKDDPAVLAELADCYAFINEVKISKAFFREAFYIDPQRVDLVFLESPIIRRLEKRLLEMDIQEPLLLEWIPVYGTLYGVFNVKRELRPIELGKLKQAVFTLENSYEECGDSRLLPRLLNKYFWLIDHHLNAGDTREKVETILLKIKRFDKSIYELYTH